MTRTREGSNRGGTRAIALLLSLLAGPQPFLARAQAAQRVDRALFVPLVGVILKVEARLTNGRLHIGTGVTVAPGVVLTSCHVVENAETVSVSKRAGRWPVVAQHAAGRHDLCFLKVPAWRGPAIEFGDTLKPPVLSQTTAAIGYTGGVDISFTEGEITAIHAFDKSWLLQTTSVFTSGASGGALLDSQARLIGILTFRLPGRQGHYYAVPAAWVRDDMPGDDDWQLVGAALNERPFWQGTPESLPFFMQAPPMEAQSQWHRLIALTHEWAQAEPDSAEPLVARGKAFEALSQPRDAILALQQALKLDPKRKDSWQTLGRLLYDEGRALDYAQALDTLRNTNAELAAELAIDKDE